MIGKIIAICILILTILGSINVYANLSNSKKDREIENRIESNHVSFLNDDPVIEWDRTFDRAADDRGQDVHQTTDGGYIITGHTAKSSASYDEDIWLIKTDSNGNMEWDQIFGGTLCDEGLSVHQTTDGGYIITGHTKSYGAGNCDIWLIRTDDKGNVIWDKTFGGSGYDVGYSIQITADGGFLIVGYTKSFGAGDSDIWLIKTDSNGNMEWNKTFGGIGYDTSHSVQLTHDKGYIISGTTDLCNGNWLDVWLIKTDSNGNMEWNKTFGGVNIEMGLSVQPTMCGGYILSGIQLCEVFGNADIWLIKTDSNGNMEWNKTYGGICDDVGFSVEQMCDGGYIIAGYTESFGAGWIDFYLIKTDIQGNIQWSETLGGKNADVCFSMQVTYDNGLIVLGCKGHPSKYNYDVWLIKIASLDNQNPYTPSKPIGNPLGKIGMKYNYTSCAIDPNGDQLYYKWDWGDGTFSEWFGPYNSDMICEAIKIWEREGTYSVKVKAKDVYGLESEWSDPLVVIMSKSKRKINAPILDFLENNSLLFPFHKYIYFTLTDVQESKTVE